MQLIEYQQIIDKQKEQIQGLNDKYNTSEVKNHDQMKHLKSNKIKELAMVEKHFNEQITQSNKFLQELKNDKIELLKDKESHTKQIKDMHILIKEQEEKMAELSNRAQLHQGNFQHIREKYDLIQQEQENQRMANKLKEIKESELVEVNQIQLLEINSLQDLLKEKEDSQAELNQKVQLLEKEIEMISQSNQMTIEQALASKNKLEADVQNKDKVMTRLSEMYKDIGIMNSKREKQIQQYTEVIIPEMKNKIRTLSDQKEELNKNLILTKNELEKLINFVDENETMKAQ